MGKWWRAYAVLGVLTVAVLALSPAKSYFSEWRFYQRTFNRLARELPVKVPEVQLGLKQIWIEEAGRIDRCISCHVGYDNPDLGSLPQPFTTHPDMPHDPREFGCTICHQGQGLATNYVSSIGLVEHWDLPVFPRKYVEAGCGRCHKESQVPDSPILSAGRRLIKEYYCASCHEIPHVEKNWSVPLDGIGVRMSRRQLQRWISHPRAVKPGTRMPDFLLTVEQAADLTDYLLTFTKLADGSSLPALPPGLTDSAQIAQRSDNGGRLFREARCISCHLVDGRGGTIAGEIGTAGTLYSPLWLWNYLARPKRLLPGVSMPRYGFSQDELGDLTSYILAELQDWEFDAAENKPPEPRPGFFERGQALWTTYNCVGCHTLSGAPAEGEKGPSLAGIGVKPTYDIEMGRRHDLPRDLPLFLQAKLTDPRSFLDNLRMPQFSFTPAEVDAIVTALLSSGGEQALPDEWLVLPHDAARPNLNGPVGRLFERYSCLTCHALSGYGGTMAPDLGAIGSQLHPEWIRDYLHVPFSRRPILTERMPNLFISDLEVDTLLAFVRLSLNSDELDQATVPAGDSGQAGRGKALFDGKYACSGCHQAKGKGGFVGPPLDGAGRRLKPGWVRAWLRDPQRWHPATIQPRLSADEDSLSALVAYILTL